MSVHREVVERASRNAAVTWIAATLAAGWTNTGGGYTGARYRLVGDVVELEGLVSATSAKSALATVLTLPAGFRPQAAVGYWDIANSAGAVLRFDVLSTGVVRTLFAISAGVNVSLHGVRFSVL